MFSVVLSSEAKAFYESADAPLAKKLARCFERLEANPRTSNNIKRLSGDSAAGIAIASVIGAFFTRSWMPSFKCSF